MEGAGELGSEIEVGEASGVVAVENSSCQDVLETDEQRCVVVQEEGSHIDWAGRVVVIVKEDVDPTERPGNGSLVRSADAMEPAGGAEGKPMPLQTLRGMIETGLPVSRMALWLRDQPSGVASRS